MLKIFSFCGSNNKMHPTNVYKLLFIKFVIVLQSKDGLSDVHRNHFVVQDFCGNSSIPKVTIKETRGRA